MKKEKECCMRVVGHTPECLVLKERRKIMKGLNAFMGLEPMMVYVVGRYTYFDVNTGEMKWLVMGVFFQEADAVAACRDETYFVGPVEMDVQLPHEAEKWPGAYYPLEEEDK